MALRDTEQIMTERSTENLPSAQGPDGGSADLSLPPIVPLAHEPESEGTGSSLRAKARRVFDKARVRVVFWSRSLLVRVVVLTLSLSTIVMLTLGLILQQQIINGLLRSKIDAATAEIDSARQTVQSSLSGADSDPSSLREQLRLALTEIGRGDGSSGAQGSTAGVFEPVIVPSRIGSEADLSITQPTGDVPAELRARIGQGQIAYQYTTVRRDGQSIPALVMGSPARTSTDSFEVYLIFPLASELSTVQVVQRTLLVGGIVLAMALTLISALVASQVVRPVRRAASSARKLAAGDLAERMPVTGPIELTTLASSFNGMAEAIRVQIRQLEEFGKLQRRFTSDVSHELRTPLTTVRMAADVLHAGREDFPPHLSRATELMVDELDRFESLLGDLLEISRYDAGMAELSAEPIDIRSSINNSITSSASLAEQFGIQIVTIVPDHPVVAEIDTRRVDRILRNLIYNAIDHADGKPIELELAADDEVLAITVTDHGVGLRPGEAGLVFNRFWRADPSRQRQTGGTGLGLAISLEDARLHGGWLQASGAPGEGARFRLTLPRRRGGLITQSPLPLRMGADPQQVTASVLLAGQPHPRPGVDGIRMMVQDGTLKPAPSDDELHPATVPEAGPTATLTSSEQPIAVPAGTEATPAAPAATPSGGAG
jgi:two-component system sensor histidine kinase MtrB